MSKLLDRIKTEKIAIQCGTAFEIENVQISIGEEWDLNTDFLLIHNKFVYVQYVEGWSWKTTLPVRGEILPAATFLAEYDREQNNKERPVTDKNDTPLNGAIRDIDFYASMLNLSKSQHQLIKEWLETYLPAEREAIEGAVLYALDNISHFGHDGLSTASDYFNQTFNQAP